MKYLLIIVIVLALLWLARLGRRKPPGRAAPPTSADDHDHEAMVACAQCGVHLPRSEARSAAGLLFCSEPHRIAYEREHPP